MSNSPQSSSGIRASRAEAKQAAAKARAAAAAVPRPRIIEIGSLAALGQVVMMLLWGVLATSAAGAMRDFYEKNYRDSKPTNPDKLKKWHPLCIDQQVAKCVTYTKHDVVLQSLVSAVLWSGIVLVLWLMIRRGSGVSRWIYVALCLIGTMIVQFPGGLIALGVIGSDMPKQVATAQFIAAIAGAIATICVILPPAAAYFRQTRSASGKPGMFGPRPDGPAGAPRAGAGGGGLLGSLFGAPRPSAGAGTPRTTAEESNPASGRSTAKVRAASTDAAIAKGAGLARERAKASKAKSRRSPDAR